MSDIDTPQEGGTEEAATEQSGTPLEWDYFDPEEDTEEAPEEMETDSEDETEAEGQPEDAAETDPEDADDQPEEGDTPPEEIELPNGEKVTRDELTKGYLRQQDYTRKTQEVAERRKALDAGTQKLNGITEAFINHVVSLMPNEPDPVLATRDPNKYTAQKAQYDAAVTQVQKLIEVGNEAKTVADGLSEEDRRTLVQEENTKLAQLFPETGEKAGRDKFFSEAAEAAMDLGFSPKELSATTDHRLFALAKWAHAGMKAEKARKAAKSKVDKAPPATPRKPGQGARQPDRNREAKRRLEKSGSIRDAVKIDFE